MTRDVNFTKFIYFPMENFNTNKLYPFPIIFTFFCQSTTHTEGMMQDIISTQHTTPMLFPLMLLLIISQGLNSKIFTFISFFDNTSGHEIIFFFFL